MTKYPELFAALAAPFETHEVKSRSAPGGKQLHYVTARTIMNRLDSVLGPECWWDDFVSSENSVLCRLTIRLPDGETVTKCDAGGYAGMSDQGDDDKSGHSDSLKRAAAKFGVGRYLYRDGVANFAAEHQEQTHTSRPSPAPVSPAPRAPTPPTDRPAQPSGNAPRSGKGLFAWTKEQEQTHDVALLKYLNSWAKLQEFPPRMIDWDDEQVALGHAEAVRKLQSLGGSQATAEHENQDSPGMEMALDNRQPTVNGQASARPPLQTPNKDKAATFAADAQRKKLSGLVWLLARKRFEVPVAEEPTKDQFWKVVADLDNVMPGGEIISDIRKCDDVAMLAKYIEIAEEQLAMTGA